MDLYKPVSFENDPNTLAELKAARLGLEKLEVRLSREEKHLPLDWINEFQSLKRALNNVLLDLDELKDKLFTEEEVDT